jgi:hypothetical protein
LRGWDEVIHLHTDAVNTNVTAPDEVKNLNLLAAAIYYITKQIN